MKVNKNVLIYTAVDLQIVLKALQTYLKDKDRYFRTNNVGANNGHTYVDPNVGAVYIYETVSCYVIEEANNRWPLTKR